MKLASHAVIMRCNVINAEDMDISKGNVQWPREEDSKVLGAEKLDTMRCRKKRSLIRTDDNESEKDEVLDLVDFGAHKDEASTSSESDSESEKGKYDDLKECYKQVCGTLVKLGKENMVLVKEQRRLEALIEVLQKDLQIEKEETRHACVKPR
ncbi:hypothetical protein DY000_02015958 [Brassica cretica]|uniref:Uncharacterized protein n=1 Tax=Brassica cretica TaxID=69181 RepID=A0ABQ7CVI5_BRACR|nr:hypothetical protein DY000_02015958 [Brassica cretica]